MIRFHNKSWQIRIKTKKIPRLALEKTATRLRLVKDPHQIRFRSRKWPLVTKAMIASRKMRPQMQITTMPNKMSMLTTWTPSLINKKSWMFKRTKRITNDFHATRKTRSSPLRISTTWSSQLTNLMRRSLLVRSFLKQNYLIISTICT